MVGLAARFWIPYSIAALFVVALLGGCGREAPSSETKLAELDRQLAGDKLDPALTAALEDQITVDPALAQQSNKLAVRPAPAPQQALYPLDRGQERTRTNGQPGARSSATPGKASAPDADASCISDFDYNPSWATRMPAPFPVFPGAKLTDAAGNDKVGCRTRVATFLTKASPRQVLDWYGKRAKGAGYSARHQLRDGDHILAGERTSDGGAYYLIVTAHGAGGSDVALLANRGA